MGQCDEQRPSQRRRYVCVVRSFRFGKFKRALAQLTTNLYLKTESDDVSASHRTETQSGSSEEESEKKKE